MTQPTQPGYTGRHVIVEGPDGAGKSTLVKFLAAATSLPVAPKISNSLNGVDGINLFHYVNGDLGRWQNTASPDSTLRFPPSTPLTGTSGYLPSQIYDRYPLISEPIYGHEVRRNVQPEFRTEWYRVARRRFIAMDPLVIFCLPPYEEVVKHVSPERDMPGVWASIPRVYAAYVRSYLEYPGTAFLYDYTMHKPGDLLPHIESHTGMMPNPEIY